ncbi:LIM/homeobox protein Awh-like [Anopheles arabiensis]|uniref:Arrowhead n=2 Tax=gambiae species complex TaxID=44542 RepID=A0A6E8VQ19_ANOCL|nr:LIM/homeobox protein Awh-like [Anopheles arabiensis]XP_040227130.2 LIM/homeobox protein Awh-like [Anopheles coluzzii]XP_041773447.1 LIM/homeobox protein Awh-like [Anopheles merus]XP_061503482.1 LIM/homeobox protein Awh [Anopheles gambiae]
MKKELRSCTACGEPISDQFLLDVGGCSWHSACLRCCICHTPLDHQPSCFLRERQIYCKTDYTKRFGTKCARCSRTISATDWVRRARDLIFHLACFACDSCGRQLSTGEQFALVDDKVLCKTHYSEMFDCGTSSDDGCEADGYQKNNKTKRVRTTFTEEQLQILQANFNIDSNPDGQDLERIASVTGLSKRVTQVWFQNSRARQKKHVQVPREGEMNPFARHINLQLSYTFQQAGGAVHNSLHLGPGGGMGVLSGSPFGPNGSFGSHHHNNNNNNNSTNINNNHSSKSSAYSTHDSSLDELSEDSAIHCMQSEA